MGRASRGRSNRESLPRRPQDPDVLPGRNEATGARTPARPANTTRIEVAGGALRARSGDRGAVVVVLADSDRVARPDVGAEALIRDAHAGTVRSTHVAKIAGRAGLSRAGTTRLGEGRCPDAGQDGSRPRDGSSRSEEH